MAEYTPYVALARPPWKPNTTVAKATVAAFVAWAALTPLSIVGLAWLRGRLRAYRAGDLDSLTAAQTKYSLLSAPAGLAATAATVLVIVLTFRLAKNNETIGRAGARFGPGWAIAGWLIPLASSVIPYLVLTDLWRGCDPDEPPDTSSWRRRPASNVIYLWWALQLVVTIVGLIFSARLALGVLRVFRDLGQGRGEEQLVASLVDAFETQIAVLVITAVERVVGAVALWSLVARQERYATKYQLRLGANTAVGALPPPDWYPDPARYHELRYWDGLRWTEHVSDGGRVSADPLRPT